MSFYINKYILKERKICIIPEIKNIYLKLNLNLSVKKKNFILLKYIFKERSKSQYSLNLKKNNRTIYKIHHYI